MASPSPRLDFRVEPGTADDLGAVMLVMGEAFGSRYGEAWTRSQCAGILPMKGIRLSLAKIDGGKTIGFALSRTVADESELLLIAVDPAHHRQGIGWQLLRNFLDQAREDGVARVHLEVREGNSAIAMYRAAGFTTVGRRRAYYRGGDGERRDALTFARDLSGEETTG